MAEILLNKFQNYIREHSLLVADDKVLLTVSGGVDSMVMLSLFARSGYNIGVAHCNFQLRGEESEQDEVLVEKEAAKYGVPFFNKRFDTAGEMERTGESVQMAARRLRYDWFLELSQSHGYTRIAIAHHADDSLETFFINLLRGTGLRGLTGITTLRGRIVRPLIFASRKDILDFAHVNHIDFREDSSNRSTKYLRNKIRLGLVPRIREINPRFTEVMSVNLTRLTDAQLFIDHAIAKIRSEVESINDGVITIDPTKIDAQYPVGFVIYELLNTYGFKGDVIDSLCQALQHGGSGKRFYAKEMVAYADRGHIVVSPIEQCDSCAVGIASGAVKVYCGNSVLYFEHFDVDSIDTLNQPDNVALIDAEMVNYPLTARRWSEGDNFVPLGMSGHKKVSDFLVDAKISMAEKGRQFVICNGDDIVWLIGRRIDDRYKITDKTENVLRITKEVV